MFDMGKKNFRMGNTISANMLMELGKELSFQKFLNGTLSNETLYGHERRCPR